MSNTSNFNELNKFKPSADLVRASNEAACAGTLAFKSPVFHKGDNLTFRVGDKWGYLNPGDIVRVEAVLPFEASNADCLGMPRNRVITTRREDLFFAEVVGVWVDTLENLCAGNYFTLDLEHDPECRTPMGLLRVLRGIYGDHVGPETTCTAIGFKREERAKPKSIYIASPYTLGDVAQNVRAQQDVFNWLRDAGYMPFAPLLSHFQHITHPRPHEDWMEYDLHWLEACDAVIRLVGESAGADQETAHAESLGIPVIYAGKCNPKSVVLKELKTL